MHRQSVRSVTFVCLATIAAFFLVAVDSATQPAPRAPEPVRIHQAWASSGTTYDNTDSLAACRLADGSVRIYATSKDGDRIQVFDAATGRHIRDLGRSGTGVGEFRYPNGIVTIEVDRSDTAPRPLIAVIERDNRRVQCFWADSLAPAGIFGTNELHRPYGGAVSYRDGQVDLYVTDTEVPLEKTVHVFRLTVDGNRVKGTHLRSFGAADGAGAIREAESVVVDDARDRVLLCDEVVNNVKVYSRDGRFLDVTFADGLVQGDPEGIALLDGPGAGLILLTDQRDAISVWYVFDRATLALRGAFTGEPTVANTDGICVFPHAFDRHSRGLFVAVHDDTELRAYDLTDIVQALPTAASRPAQSSSE